MSEPRIFQAVPLAIDETLDIDEAASHHLSKVLRIAVGETICLFNGEGGEYTAKIQSIQKRFVSVKILSFSPKNLESSLELSLAQGISRGEKMDFVIQKAVELGVKYIYPLFTERCNVKLDEERKQKRHAHWQAIIISACEQCGRNTLPILAEAQSLTQWLEKTEIDLGFTLAPTAEQKLKDFDIPKHAKLSLLIGPEGGLSESEILLSAQKNFKPLNLGPRILRTETAALAALTALQCEFGDMLQ